MLANPEVELRGMRERNSITGILAVQDTVAFDYELNQNLSIMVIVSDDHANSLAYTAEINHYTISLQPGGERSPQLLWKIRF